jgi:hypothetical protein
VNPGVGVNVKYPLDASVTSSVPFAPLRVPLLLAELKVVAVWPAPPGSSVVAPIVRVAPEMI